MLNPETDIINPAALQRLYRALKHLVRLMEPKEQEGGLDIPGLATLNGARKALEEAEKPGISIIYIGERFYDRSESMMSSIYTEGGQRADWGFVQCALRDGHTLLIRPATKEEVAPYEQALESWEKR